MIVLDKAGTTFTRETMGPFADLPAEVLDLVLEHLDRVEEPPRLYTVACAAQTLTALSQVHFKWHCAHMYSILLGCAAHTKDRCPWHRRCAEVPNN